MVACSTEAGSEGDAGGLAIVVVSFHAESLLAECLTALARQGRVDGVETVVVRARRDLAATPSEPVRRAFPDVRFIEAPSGCTVPRMRAIGIALSRRSVVALIEDDCIVQEGWTDAVLAAHRGPEVAIGGAVEPGPYSRGLDWGVFFCDYGRFTLPLPVGTPEALPGSNLSCKRAALANLSTPMPHEFHEVLAYAEWRPAGLPMRMDPSVVIVNVSAWSWADVTSIPYHHGRAYAGARLANQPLFHRLLMSLLALPLPVLKVARVARAALARRRFIGPFFRSLPWVIVLSISWSLGESAGYLRGPGDSPSKWR